MTYCLDKKSPIAQSQSRLLQLLGKVLPCITRPFVLKWSTTQVRGAGPWGRPISAICRVGALPGRGNTIENRRLANPAQQPQTTHVPVSL